MMTRAPRLFSLSALLSLLAAALFTVAPTLAQEPDDEIRTADYDVQALSYPDLRDFEAPEPKRLTLANGLTVFLLEDHELPQVNAVARISTGSVYEPAEKRGLASITGTVMRSGGTESMAPDSLNQALENIGATVETSIGETSGSAYMSTLSDHVDSVLPLFADVLRRPAFAEAKVQQAKSQQKSAISRRNDNARGIASRELDQLIYGEDSPYARIPEYYTVDRITRQDLIDFHGQHFHPNNVLLSVWGDFDTETMKQKLRQQFGDWSAPDDFQPPTPPQPTASREYSVNFVQKDDVNQSTILMGHPGSLTRDDPDYPAVTIMNEVLSGGFSGRLFQNVRREKGLAYSVLGSYSAGYNRPGRFFAGVSTKSATTVEATNAVLHEVKGMRQTPPTDEELSLAKDSYLNSFVFNFDTTREILSRLMTYEYYDYPSDFLQQTTTEIEDVTSSDVQQVAKTYLYPEQAHILVVGNREQFSDSLSTLTKGGSVHELDISIPKTPPGEQETVSAEAKKAGLAALKQARQTLGGEDAFRSLQNMRVVTKQGGRTVTLVVALPNKLRVERGPMTIVSNGETAKMKRGGQTRTLPSSIQGRFEGQLWRDLTYLMSNLNHEDLTAQDQGSTTVEGTTYRTVKVTPPAGSAYTIYLEPESMRPARMSYQAQTRQGPKSTTSVYSNFQTVKGMEIPHKTVTYQNGKQVATSSIQKISINANLESDLFTMGSSSE
jgi:predicted Zn-dependent peptidase/outer membrane lipoprotein-sorting protein